jgi:tetratricopeptide (TPR) repeat protein
MHRKFILLISVAFVFSHSPIFAETIVATPQEATPISPAAASNTSLGAGLTNSDLARIREILKHLGYPEKTWPGLEKELTFFLDKIDFPSLKTEAQKAKPDPQRLQAFLSRLGESFKKHDCLNPEHPHPLIALLVGSLSGEDIFQAIDTSPITQNGKAALKKYLVSCSAISQLGVIVLELLDIHAKAATAPDHIFSCVALDDSQYIFVDFIRQIFPIVDINQYYALAGKYRILKEEYRLSPEKVQQINDIWAKGVPPIFLTDILNLLSNVYITDDYTVTPFIYNSFAVLYAHKGDYDQAISYCNQALQSNPNNAWAYNNRGLAYGLKGSYDRAVSDFNKAVELDPNFAEAYSNRGNAYRGKGNYDRAISDFNKAVELYPNFAEAYSNRGLVHDDKGNYDRAISDFSKAIELDPNNADAYSYRGGAYGIKGNIDQAISDLNKAIELNPNDAGAYSNRGVAYGTKGNIDQAISDFNKAIELNPNDADAYSNRGVAYGTKGNIDRAISGFNKAIELNPNDADVYSNRGLAYGLKGNYDQAISDFNKAIELDPNNVPAHNGRVAAYYFKQEYGRAWEDVHKIERLGGKVPPDLLEMLKKASGRDK